MGIPANEHPSDQMLHAYGLGTLDDGSADALNAHLEQCADCRQRVSAVSSDSFLRRLCDSERRPEESAMGRRSPQPSQQESGEPVPHRPADDAVPQELADNARYRVIKELGRGGMGVVYLAHNTEMDRPEVLKVLNPEMLARRGTAVERFLREIRTAGKLNHPNVVHAYSTFELGRLRVFAMEYVHGENLADLVRKRGALPVTLSCQFIYQAALGLQHAHEAGTIHRDIKPGNLMVARQGQRAIVKVLDFGLAKAMREGPVESARTHEGQALGTPDYNAPEQIIDARNVDIRADIYSLGCTLHYLLTGQPPFQGKSLYDIYQAHISTEAVSLNLMRADVTLELAAVVGKMMAKEPDRRYRTPAEVAEALKPFCRPSAVTAPAAEISQVRPPDGGRSTAAGLPASEPQERWASLINLDPQERSGERLALRTQPVVQKPRSIWPVAVVGAAFVACLVGWIITLTVRTKNGTVVLEGLPDDAHVTVDGGTVVIRGLHGKPAEITVQAGEHALTVTREGYRPFEDEVAVGAGEATRIRVFLSALPKPTPARQIDAHQFTIDQGQWIRQGDELLQADSRVWACLLFGDPEWTDYDFSADLMRVHGVEAGFLIVRATDRENHIRINNGGWAGTISAIQTRTGGSDRDSAQHADYRFENGKWYTARVRVRGGRIEYSLRDGPNQVAHVEDVDDLHPKGRVGLSSWWSAYRFKNIKVTAPDGRVLWTGLPAIPSPPPLETPSAPREYPAGSVLPFNGKDLTGWDAFRGHEYAAAEQLFFVDHDELVSFPGNSGALVTQDAYSDFQASFDFHVAPGDDAGALFVTADSPQQRKWLECQTVGEQTGDGHDCGDVYAEEGLLDGGLHHRGTVYYFQRKDHPELNRDGWNTYVVRHSGSNFTISLNGRVVNELRSTWHGAWRLGLQTEGRGSVRFRNLAIQGLNGKAPTIVKVSPSPVARFESTAPDAMKPDAKKRAFDVLNVQSDYRYHKHQFDAGRFDSAQYHWEFYPVKAHFVAREAFGRNDVLCTHPIAENTPATIDFSAFTKGRSGTLLLTTHSFPDTGNDGGRVVVNVDEKVVHDFRFRFDEGWKTVAVPFNDASVHVEHHAVGWNSEYAFLDFAITANDAASNQKNPGTGSETSGAPNTSAPGTGIGLIANAQADLRREGALGFPQAQAALLCDESGLRVSAWNDSAALFVQAVLWDVSDEVPADPAKGPPPTGSGELLVDVDGDGKITAQRDRKYYLNPQHHTNRLEYVVCLSDQSVTTLRGDSKGRGAIRFVGDGKGRRIRVDSFLIPLAEIGRKPHDVLRLAYYGVAPSLNLPVNSVGFRNRTHYFSYALPWASLRPFKLVNRPDVPDLARFPEDRHVSGSIGPGGARAIEPVVGAVATDPARSGFQAIFDGKDLTGWKVDSGLASSWRVGSSGELVVTGSRSSKHQGFLVTERRFSEFLLRLEFLPAPGAHSGVSFWQLPGEFAGRLPHPIKIELLDRDTANAKIGSFEWSRSTVRGFVAPEHTVELKPAGSWNLLELDARRNRLTVAINGQRALQADLDKLAASPDANPALRRRIGCIGLESRWGTVRFRNIQVKELTPSQSRDARPTSP